MTLTEETDIQEDVRLFHVKFGHRAPTGPVGSVVEVSNDTLEFRISLIQEECRELVEAIRDRNLAKICAEGIDLMYVVVGLFVILGIPFLPFWRDVQRANMTKETNPAGGKPLKPEGWVGPQPKTVLYEVRRSIG